MSNNREQVLDLIRAIAIFLVVVNHAVEQVFDFHLEAIQNMSAGMRIFAFSGFTLGRIGVPLFMMLTGYLLLSRQYDLDGIKRFYKKNLLPLLITWEIWVLLYHVFLCLYNKTSFSLVTYLKEAFFVKKMDLPHAWYAPYIIGIYLFIPLVAIVLQKLDKKLLFILAAIVFVYFFIVPSVNLFRPAETRLNLYYSGGIYGLYLTAGYYLKTHAVKITKAFQWLCSIICVLALFALTVFVQIYLCRKGQFYTVWYDFVLMPPLGILVFLLLAQKKKVVCNRLFYRISVSAFGIYLIHELIMVPFIDIMGTTLSKAAEVIVITIGTFIISFLVVEIISLIPKVGKILFLRKN